jgi:VCBS repeat-containing protein
LHNVIDRSGIKVAMIVTAARQRQAAFSCRQTAARAVVLGLVAGSGTGAAPAGNAAPPATASAGAEGACAPADDGFSAEITQGGEAGQRAAALQPAPPRPAAPPGAGALLPLPPIRLQSEDGSGDTGPVAPEPAPGPAALPCPERGAWLSGGAPGGWDDCGSPGRHPVAGDPGEDTRAPNTAPAMLDGVGEAEFDLRRPGEGTSQGGVLRFGDPDMGDRHLVSTVLLGDAGAASLGQFAAELAISAGPGQAGAVAWSYTLDPDAARALAEGELAEERYLVRLTDAAGAMLVHEVVVCIRGANDAPVRITLSDAILDEATPGAVIGTLRVEDPDRGDMHLLSVSDARFMVQDGVLRLRPGIALDHETEPGVTLSITATDAGGLLVTQGFFIAVRDADRHVAADPSRADPLDLTALPEGADVVVHGFRKAEVLRFDDIWLPDVMLAERRIPDGHGGFAWLSTGVYDTRDVLGLYTSSSGTRLAFISEAGGGDIPDYDDTPHGSPATLLRGDDFDLLSLVLSPAFRTGIPVTLTGFDAAGGVLAQRTVLLGAGLLTLDLRADGFTGLRRLEMSANDGDDATLDYFGFDDLTFAPTEQRDGLRLSIPGIGSVAALRDAGLLQEVDGDTLIAWGSRTVRLAGVTGLGEADLAFG